MLEAGYDVNARNQRMETPLMACVKHCHDPVCRAGVLKLLLDGGADINLRNGRGQSVLMYSCILNQLDTVIAMLQRENLDVNQDDDDGNTALMYACNLGFPEVAAALLESHRLEQHIIDFSKENYDGYTAIDHAFDAGHLNIVRLLSKFIKVPEVNLIGEHCEIGDKVPSKTIPPSVVNTPQINESILRYIKDVQDSAAEKQDQSSEKKDTLILPASLSGSGNPSKNMNDCGLVGEFQGATPDNLTDTKEASETNEAVKKKSNRKDSSQFKLNNSDHILTPSPVSNLQKEALVNKELPSGEDILSEHNDEQTMPKKQGKSPRRLDDKFGSCDNLPVRNTSNQGICSPTTDILIQNQHRKESPINMEYVSSPELNDNKSDIIETAEKPHKAAKTTIMAMDTFSTYGKPLPKISDETNTL